MTEHVRIAHDGGVLTLTLARPEKKNALTQPMYAALATALVDAEADPAVRAILLLADGETFCAGNDIADFAAVASGQAGGERPAGLFLRALAMAEKPLVAGVQGAAIGIGTTMLLHCDLVFTAEDASLSVPFVNLALVPEAASSLLLPARVGHARAYAMFALGEAVDGRTAATIGIANAAVPAGEVQQRARDAAQALARRPLDALRMTKRLMRDAATLTGVMDRELTAFNERLKSAEAVEAFRAFAERRAPDFTKVPPAPSAA